MKLLVELNNEKMDLQVALDRLYEMCYDLDHRVTHIEFALESYGDMFQKMWAEYHNIKEDE